MNPKLKDFLRTVYYSSNYKLTTLSTSLKKFVSRGSITPATDFVNSNNLSSLTEYLIWVDTKAFRTYVFKGSKNNWVALKNYECSIGKPSTPTPKGLFKVGLTGDYFGQNHGYICKYYTQFKGNYLFHSILYNLDGTIKDGRLGMAISNGCVRLATPNAKWIWSNIPKDTTVYIT